MSYVILMLTLNLIVNQSLSKNNVWFGSCSFSFVSHEVVYIHWDRTYWKRPHERESNVEINSELDERIDHFLLVCHHFGCDVEIFSYEWSIYVWWIWKWPYLKLRWTLKSIFVIMWIIYRLVLKNIYWVITGVINIHRSPVQSECWYWVLYYLITSHTYVLVMNSLPLYKVRVRRYRIVVITNGWMYRVKY
jgi:hypothetical protein